MLSRPLLLPLHAILSLADMRVRLRPYSGTIEARDIDSAGAPRGATREAVVGDATGAAAVSNRFRTVRFSRFRSPPEKTAENRRSASSSRHFAHYAVHKETHISFQSLDCSEGSIDAFDIARYF